MAFLLWMIPAVVYSQCFWPFWSIHSWIIHQSQSCTCVVICTSRVSRGGQHVTNVILPQPKEIAPLLELLQRLPFWDEFSIFPGCFRVWFLGLSPLPLLQTRAVVHVVSFFATIQSLLCTWGNGMENVHCYIMCCLNCDVSNHNNNDSWIVFVCSDGPATSTYK